MNRRCRAYRYGPLPRLAGTTALVSLTVMGACSSQRADRMPGLRSVAVPTDVRDARGRAVSRRALQAYTTSQIRTAERRYGAADQALSRLPGVVSVQPGAGVVYVYTHRPAALPKEYDGMPVKALPPEFIDGVSDDWVTPDQLPPLGQGD